MLLTLAAAVTLDGGAGDSVLAKGGRADGVAMDEPGLWIGACLILGDAIFWILPGGLVDPAAGPR